MESIARHEILTMITHSIPTKSSRTFIGIDRPPGSGKTTLAKDLVLHLQSQGRKTVLIYIDDFIYPYSVRWSSNTPSNVLRRVNYGAFFDTV
jgi:uridine kinase